MNSYSALGNWFENLNSDCGYEEWARYLADRLKSYGAGPAGVDVGCGNGYFTRALYRAGYAVCGVDISPQMLTVAKRTAEEEGVPCEFLLGDITKLKLTGKTHFITAVNDCINYVPPKKLKSTFTRIYGCLNRGGVFHFDISSANKIRNVLGENMFGDNGEELSYMWFNTQTEDGVIMDLTFFKRKKEGGYARFDEQHRQYAHGEDEIIGALGGAGFCKILAEGFLGSSDKSLRIHFTCKKS